MTKPKPVVLGRAVKAGDTIYYDEAITAFAADQVLLSLPQTIPGKLIFQPDPPKPKRRKR